MDAFTSLADLISRDNQLKGTDVKSKLAHL